MADIKVGLYLFTRLSQLGIKTVWGVPGDYELALLDLIGEADIKFSGNPNELVASYAADGYARINGVGAFVTTFGPGELSAYCGHAGAFTEFVPVVHIVGYPAVSAMKAHRIMHHSLGFGEFGQYHEMVKQISADTTVLTDPSKAVSEIDRVLNTMIRESRPVYIGVPVDIHDQLVSSSELKTPIEIVLPPNRKGAEGKVVSEIRSWLEKKTYPVIIVDGSAIRNDCLEEANRLAEITGLPTFGTCMSKGGPNEDAANYGGVYEGGGSHPAIKKAVQESSDAVLWIGSFRSDFNTGEFTDDVKTEVTIDFQRFFVKIAGQKYDVKMKYVLQALIKSIESSPLARTSSPKVDWDPYPMNAEKGEILTQDYLWPALGKLFRPGDLAIAETGTSAFGIADSRLPRGASMYNQTIWGSIGYATPSATGAFQAAKENGKYKRGILVTGEGSLQLTVQTFADMLKLDLKPIVFVLNNNGYTIERLIHGAQAFYNTLPVWDYSGLAKVFGPEYPSKYHGPIRTADELDKLLADEEFNSAPCFQLVELVLGEMDAPISVRLAAAAVEAFNKQRGPTRGTMGG